MSIAVSPTGSGNEPERRNGPFSIVTDGKNTPAAVLDESTFGYKYDVIP